MPAAYKMAPPLFGEITSDGQWYGNFDLERYAPLSTFVEPRRRSSHGDIALSHGRSQSHYDVWQSGHIAPQHQGLSHKRSRSDMDAFVNGNLAPRSFQQDRMSGMYPLPLSTINRKPVSPGSRIPIINRRPLGGSPADFQSGGEPATSDTSAGPVRPTNSPARKNHAAFKENIAPIPPSRSRYHPALAQSEATGQTLSAKILALPPKLSPPLRSSRPRQPVSAATTSASRARAAEQYPNINLPRDVRRPSEQWLGKPYDPQQERSKRKIPELSGIDFEERRARIQKAISQNLEESRSLEELRARSRSRNASGESSKQADPGAEMDGSVSAKSTPPMPNVTPPMPNRARTGSMPGGWPTPGGLTVDTFNVPDHAARAAEPRTATSLLSPNSGGTEFDFDESPILGRPADSEPTLLTPAVYQPPNSRSALQSPDSENPQQDVNLLPSPSVLDNVMRMRIPSPGHSSIAEDSTPISATDSPNDIENKWGIGHGVTSISGSIKIMLDGPWEEDAGVNDAAQPDEDMDPHNVEPADDSRDDAGGYDACVESPEDAVDEFNRDPQFETPRSRGRQDTIRAWGYASDAQVVDRSDSVDDISRLLKHYKSTGTLTAEMVEHVQRHMVDLQRASVNEGSNGFMIQSLLDSVLNSQQETGSMEMREVRTDVTVSHDFEVPIVTPNTPIGWEFSEHSGTALVYTSEPSPDFQDEEEAQRDEEFHIRIQKANEEWEHQQHLCLGAEDDEEEEEEDTLRPRPPPKDLSYISHSSTGADSATLPEEFARGLRISTIGYLDLPDAMTGNNVEPSPLSSSAPPQPAFAPPPPPSLPASSSASHLPFELPDIPLMPATYSERASSELSPITRKSLWGASGSSRPSTDSQRPLLPPLPGSTSVTSLTESNRQDSVDATADGQKKAAQTASTNPEYKRLLKRRHIIREILDTENTYHQDLKIIEDIYRATAVPDVISPEDKKILFSNCDDIERFSLRFYDELRKAAAPVYMPAKKGWANNRGSMSTTESDGIAQPSDNLDDDKDRATTIGAAFLRNLQQMENFYGYYLKNHDVANQRLGALRHLPAVKCWLDECHSNACDITFAWDLDSLLVKPTQRAAKYPLLLQQLLDTTPASHPDREALATAAKDCLDMLSRINDAKKRADLVDQIVNRKRKESDVRSGIAKAFGRRTEKLKERVGIAEAFQDTEFDDLAHRFGGHFVRLQICMRDVQDYMNRIEKAVEQINNYALALDFFADVAVSPIPELESKWRKYGQVIREITSVAFSEHKAAVNKRVIQPMVTCIKLHEGPQNAINNRKKRIVDYAKCKSIEKRGEKPDKKTIEAADLYVALNDQLKIELPKLYAAAPILVLACLRCFLDIQITWYDAWQRKLAPVLEAADIPSSIQDIESAFRPDFDMVKGRISTLAICNGSLLADAAGFLSPTSTLDEMTPNSTKRPSTLNSSKRTMSVGSEVSPVPPFTGHQRSSSSYTVNTDSLPSPYDSRIRSSSSQGVRGGPPPTPASAMSANRMWSGNTPVPAIPSSRPSTANQPPTSSSASMAPRISADQPRSPRPLSGATYFTARPEQPEDRERTYSSVFNSAMPASDSTPDLAPTTPQTTTSTPEDLQALFVCASLFEFSIEKTRREAGYPYLTYVQGEVFDVIAQKGELWLAKNQDDAKNTLGWIWEQHFVVLSQN